MWATALAELAFRRNSVQSRQSGVFPSAGATARRCIPVPAIESAYTTCDPQCKEQKLDAHLSRIESALVEAAVVYDGISLTVATMDKSRQSALNRLGGATGAGDKAMEAYFDTIRTALTIAGMSCEQPLYIDLFRLSPMSDEGIALIAGKGLPSSMAVGLERALIVARQGMDLKKYKYTFAVPYGGNEAFDLNLEAFSRVLRNPEMCTSCKLSLSKPRPVKASEKKGFISNEVNALEEKEISFRKHLPEPFRNLSEGMAEVATPFSSSLIKNGTRMMDSGFFVEIKLGVDEKDAKALLQFTRDTGEWMGTRKGFAGIFSRQFTMRELNTFIGKLRTNKILSAIAHGMKDLEGYGAKVIPVNGCFLRYWVDMPENLPLASMVKNSLEQRLWDYGLKAGPSSPGLHPSVVLLDARGIEVPTVRERFILKSLGREGFPPEVLDMTDFFVNFIENIHPTIQERVFSRLAAEGGGQLKQEDRWSIGALTKVCGIRRTIRDTEDIVWVLRRDEELPDDIKRRKTQLEDWLYEFAADKVGKIARFLAEEIARIARMR